MKNILVLIALLIFTVVSYSQTDRTKVPEPDEPQPLELGKMESFTLDNGLNVFLVQSKGYPKFQMSINIQQPGYNEEDRSEARKIMSDIYFAKKSQKYPEEQIDSIVGYLGGMLSITTHGGHIRGMKRDIDVLLGMYSDLLLHPVMDGSFIAKEIEKQKEEKGKKKEKRKAEKKKNGIEITTHLLDSLIYGSASKPKKEEPETDFEKITIKDVKDYLQDRMVANNTLIVVIGDFTPRECKQLMEKYLGNWHQGEHFVRENDQEAGNPCIKKRLIYVVDKPSAVQSSISLHWPMHDAFMHFEKETELNILNEIFGSSQMSYLYRNVREDKGLCYYIGSNIGTSGGGGSAYIKTDVKTDKTALAIENIILEMLRIRNEKVSKHDLQIAKNSLIGEFSRSLSVIAPMYYISFAMSKQVYNLPDDYLQTRIPAIYKVTANDIHKMARKYINPFECLVIVKGNANELKGQLEKFGEVTYLDKEGKKMFE